MWKPVCTLVLEYEAVWLSMRGGGVRQKGRRRRRRGIPVPRPLVTDWRLRSNSVQYIGEKDLVSVGCGMAGFICIRVRGGGLPLEKFVTRCIAQCVRGGATARRAASSESVGFVIGCPTHETLGPDHWIGCLWLRMRPEPRPELHQETWRLFVETDRQKETLGIHFHFLPSYRQRLELGRAINILVSTQPCGGQEKGGGAFAPHFPGAGSERQFCTYSAEFACMHVCMYVV